MLQNGIDAGVLACNTPNECQNVVVLAGKHEEPGLTKVDGTVMDDLVTNGLEACVAVKEPAAVHRTPG